MHSNNNIYRNRNGVETRNGLGISGGRYNGNRTANNVFSDRQGNVYQRGTQGQWQRQSNRLRTPVNTYSPDINRNLDRQQQMRAFGQSRVQSFQRTNGFSSRSFGGMRGGGFSAGGFHGGGGGRR